MGLFNNSCPRCWDSPPYCTCTTEQMDAYYKQAEINRNRHYETTEPGQGDIICHGLDENKEPIDSFYVREVKDGVIHGQWCGKMGGEETTWTGPYIKVCSVRGEFD